MRLRVLYFLMLVISLYTTTCVAGIIKNKNVVPNKFLYVASDRLPNINSQSATYVSTNTYLSNDKYINSLQSNEIIFKSPIWKKDDVSYAMLNSIILYNVPDLQELIHHYTPQQNILNIDTIIGEPNIYILELQYLTHVDIEELCNLISKENYCENAEPDYLVFSPSLSDDYNSNPLYVSQWGLHDTRFSEYNMNVEQAWNISTGKGIIVAVNDCGVDLDHEDLYNNLLVGYDCTDGKKDGLNGSYGSYIDSIEYIDRHGTYCSGIIAAENNDVGIVGCAFESKILPIRSMYLMDTMVISKTQWTLKSFRKAVEAGADIISNSWSNPESSVILNKGSERNHTKWKRWEWVYFSVLNR